jgi:hypothetical protein
LVTNAGHVSIHSHHCHIRRLRGAELTAALLRFRDHLSASWRREQFERWLDEHDAFFSRERQHVSPFLTDSEG